MQTPAALHHRCTVGYCCICAQCIGEEGRGLSFAELVNKLAVSHDVGVHVHVRPLI